MKARQFKQSSESAHPKTVMNSFVEEALAKQAAMRPPKTPPKVLSITPTLPKVRGIRRRKRAK